MANKNLFQTYVGQIAEQTVLNEAGGSAYLFSDKQALAQYASTGCLNSTFYATDKNQFDTVVELTKKVEPEFIAKTAVYARTVGLMKDMPALLCAILAAQRSEYFEKVFKKVIDSAKMLRNFVQIIRSGVTGRRSLGSVPRALIRNWLAAQTNEQLFFSSIGSGPSLSDLIKMVHPKPKNAEREAMFGYLLGWNVNLSKLPRLVQEYEAFKQETREADRIIRQILHKGIISNDKARTQLLNQYRNKLISRSVPAVPFQFLTSLSLGQKEWTEIARTASWQTVRMNLNTFARHGVFENKQILFENKQIVDLLADRLRDRDLIRKSKAFPYQLMAAYLNVDDNIPTRIKTALQDAMEIASDNVPALNGKLAVCVDVSGSMACPITGFRNSADSKVRCVDVAALIASVLIRKNPEAIVLPFDTKVYNLVLNPNDSIMTNAQKLNLNGGGTDCSIPLAKMNHRKISADYVLLISDCESWIDSKESGTKTMKQWNIFRKRNRFAKLICVDLQPYRTCQAPDDKNIANVGGFSDAVFDFINSFFSKEKNEHWIETIENISLD